MTLQIIKCPGCGDVHALDKARLTKNGPNHEGVLKTGYRTECEGCGEEFFVRITITDVGEKTEKAEVVVVVARPYDEATTIQDGQKKDGRGGSILAARHRDRIADRARIAFADEAAEIGKSAGKAIGEKYGLDEDLSDRIGAAITRVATEQDAEEALAPLYAKQTKAKAAAVAAGAKAGSAAVDKL